MRQSPGVQANSGDSDEEGDHRRSTLTDAVFQVIRARIYTEGSTRAGLLPVSWITPESVSLEAGFTTEIFDELWPARGTPEGTKLSAFEAFLFHVFGTYRGPVLHDDFVESMPGLLDDLEELIRVGAGNLIANDIDWIGFRMALAVSVFSLHERTDYSLFIDELTDLYEVLVYHLGRRVRPPMTSRDFAMNMSAALDGPWIRRLNGMADPNPKVAFKATPDSETKLWSLDAIAMWAITMAMTEPIE
ncbi:MAG: hypothetical protein KDB26_02900 [Microthrixaceae bacterium]|nr:hypothetical protein [Microthrixaceae bacterium]